MEPTVEVIEMQPTELLSGSDPEFSILNGEEDVVIGDFEFLE